jgi:hypothetical protein
VIPAVIQVFDRADLTSFFSLYRRFGENASECEFVLAAADVVKE